MSLPIPNLDDRSFDDLMKEARSLIPIYNKEWTNHNPSDPGITLLELFAWLCEMVIYRIDQVPEENYRRFLALIGIEYVFCWEKVPGEDDRRLREFLEQSYGADWVKIAGIQKSDQGKTITISTESDSLLLALNDEETKVTMTFDSGETYDLIVKRDKTIYEALDKDIQRGLTLMSQRHRAITSDDYEFLALECMEKLQKGLAGRAICMNNRDLEFNKGVVQSGHVSVILIPMGKGYVFNWDKISGEDNGEDNLTLLKFLMQIFGADWIRTAEIEKSEDEKTISISRESNSIWLTLDDGEEKVIMTPTIYRSYQYELSVVKEVVKEEEANGQMSRKVYGYCISENNPSDLLKDKVKEYLDKRRLITTRVHVVSPDYRAINLEVHVVLKENTVMESVIDKAETRIKKYYDPLEGGQEGRGWPLGRNIYRSEIYHLLEGTPGIDHVEKVIIKILINDQEKESNNFVEIEPDQLISVGEIVIEVHNE